MSSNVTHPFPESSIDLISSKGMDEARQLYEKRDQNVKLPINKLTEQRALLPTLLAYYLSELEKTERERVLFSLLKEQQKTLIKDRLIFTYYLLYAQYQLHAAEDRQHMLGDLLNAMMTCTSLIDELAKAGNITPEDSLEEVIAESEKYFKLCGLTIVAPYVVQKIMAFINQQTGEFSTGKTVITKKIMSDVNGWRLYWVWGGGMLASVLDLLSDDFFNKPQAQWGVNAPAPITGYMSWLLYYTRFGINLGLLLKHTIKGPWMDAQEAEIPWTERFMTQWDQRKFALLNDSIWATANMSCFFWLRGAGALGYAGNIVTAGLLLMDLTLTIWRFWEETTAYNKKMLLLQQTQQRLTKELAAARADSNPDQDKIATLEQKSAENLALQQKIIVDRGFEKLGSINDLVYAAGLLGAFALMCCFFCPPALVAPATLMMIGLAGAALSFALTVVYAAISNSIDMIKYHHSSKQNKAICAGLLQQFNDPTNDVLTQKQLYVEMKALMAQSVYQQQMATFQAVKLARSILIDALIPAVIFSSLVFMPLGIGLGIMAGGLVLALLSNSIINQFEPKLASLSDNYTTELDEQFNAFKGQPNLAHFEQVSLPKKPLFFSSPASKGSGYEPINQEQNSSGFSQDSLLPRGQ